jgi:raffinose/stachyose/melibiose transport system permease protein
MIAVAVVFFLPFYLLIGISLKSLAGAYVSPLSFPTHLHFENYSQAWSSGQNGGLAHAMENSAIITIGSLIGLIVLGALAAYALARRTSKLSTGMYLMIVLGIVVPIQLAILPLYSAMRNLHLLGSYLGMILLYTGLFMPLSVFLYTGFIRAMPKEFEEAAEIDGAGFFRMFTRVILPLLRPVTATVALLTGLAVWNDFFVSLIFLSGSNHVTVPVELYSSAEQNIQQWNVVFAGVVIAIAPVLILFIFAQRFFVRGFGGGLRG